ncbi:MAG: GNAT family N-acetyltransferase [Rhizobiales bacterium]|nr:GNAT family N-acetyltransferase [Hyphomicrobiales bacterium]
MLPNRQPAAGADWKAVVVKSYLIRPIDESERADWEPLWQGYLTFYETSLPRAVTDVTWARLHDPAEPMFALGAYVDGTLSGIVHYLFHRSCWTVGNYCYLQDLFVADGARNLGLGRALIAAVEAKARAAGASRVYWLTKEDNHNARALYDKVADRPGFIQYRKLF